MNFNSIKIYPNELNKVLEEYNESIIIAVSPSCNLDRREGSFRIALIYHKYKKIYYRELKDIASSNKCAIYGLIEGASHITQPKNVVIMTATTFGFKRALSRRSDNQDIWDELFEVLEKKGCPNLTEVVVFGGGDELAKLTDKTSKNSDVV